MAKKRPGVMLYFDWIPALERLSPAERGELLMAVLTYAQNGKEPVFNDRLMLYAWACIRPHIDADEERYNQLVQQRRDAVNKRWEGTREPRQSTADTPRQSTVDTPRQRNTAPVAARSAADPWSSSAQAERMNRYLDF